MLCYNLSQSLNLHISYRKLVFRLIHCLEVFEVPIDLVYTDQYPDSKISQIFIGNMFRIIYTDHLLSKILQKVKFKQITPPPPSKSLQNLRSFRNLQNWNNEEVQSNPKAIDKQKKRNWKDLAGGVVLEPLIKRDDKGKYINIWPGLHHFSISSIVTKLTRLTICELTPHCTAEYFWFFCDLYLRFIAPINLWNKKVLNQIIFK